MRLQSFFRRRQAAAGQTAAAAVGVASPAREALPPEKLAELQEAWAELAEAAKGSGVTSLHACTRNGRPWEEDPEAVRGLAATLRDIQAPSTDGDSPAGS